MEVLMIYYTIAIPLGLLFWVFMPLKIVLIMRDAPIGLVRLGIKKGKR